MENEIYKILKKYNLSLKKRELILADLLVLLNSNKESEIGWDCILSPTGKCNYEQEDGSYDEDSCRYCNNPEERK